MVGAMKATNYDKEKTQTFMLQSLELLMNAATVELAYHQLTGSATVLRSSEKHWISHLTFKRLKMEQTNHALTTHH